MQPTFETSFVSSGLALTTQPTATQTRGGCAAPCSERGRGAPARYQHINTGRPHHRAAPTSPHTQHVPTPGCIDLHAYGAGGEATGGETHRGGWGSPGCFLGLLPLPERRHVRIRTSRPSVTALEGAFVGPKRRE